MYMTCPVCSQLDHDTRQIDHAEEESIRQLECVQFVYDSNANHTVVQLGTDWQSRVLSRLWALGKLFASWKKALYPDFLQEKILIETIIICQIYRGWLYWKVPTILLYLHHSCNIGRGNATHSRVPLHNQWLTKRNPSTGSSYLSLYFHRPHNRCHGIQQHLIFWSPIFLLYMSWMCWH